MGLSFPKRIRFPFSKLSKPIPMSLGYVGANILSILSDDAIIAG